MRSVPPPGWRIARKWGPRPFVTRALLRRDDGIEVEWTSRRQRKRLGLRAPTERPGPIRGFRPQMASAMSWAIGLLFMVGSTCFALGSLPWYFNAVPGAVGGTFFVGSIFFTSAAYLQFQETGSAPQVVLPGSAASPRGLGLDFHRIDWWSTAIQLFGTLMFNVSTFSAMFDQLSTDESRLFVWTPNVVGSICFLVSSLLAYSEVVSGPWWRPQRDIGWSVSALNLVGSIGFGVSAVAARYPFDSTAVANPALVNLGTLAGAVCFFIAAMLLPVESATESAREPEG